MIPLKIEMLNFQSYKEPETVIDFKGFNYACLCGENGHGKSTIIDAMLFALWGKGRAPTNADFINTGAADARVEFEFETEGVRYRIMRTLTRKKDRAVSTYDIQVYDLEAGKWSALGQGQKGKRTIEDILKMDYSAFICSSFILQGGANEFTKRTPSERKDVLSTILNLSDYEDLAALCRMYSTNASNTINVAEGMLAKIPTSNTVTLEQAETALNKQQGLVDFYASEKKHTQALLDGYNIDLAKISVKLESYEKLVEEGNELSVEKHAVAGKLKAENEALEKLSNLLVHNEDVLKNDVAKYIELSAEKEKCVGKQSRWSAYSMEIIALSEKRQSAKINREENIERIKREIDRSQKEINLIETSPEPRCNVCNSVLDSKSRAELLTNKHLEIKQKQTDIRDLVEKPLLSVEEEKVLEKLKSDRDALNWDEKELLEVERQMALVKYAVSAKEEYDRAKIAKGHHEKAQKEYAERLEAIEKRLSFITSEEAKADPLRDELKDITQKVLDTKKALHHHEEAFDKNRDAVETTKLLIAEIKQNAEARKNLEADIEKASKTKFLHDELAKAFGKNGIQALMIENAVPEIEAEANSILAKLTEGGMYVTLDMVKPTQKGTEKETLEIKIQDPFGVRSYETFSGGEAFRIDFALRVAISKFIANRAGAQLRTLVIDEGFGSQDKKGIQYFVEAIDSIKDDFDMVLVVTHLDELKDRFPVRIEVVKDAEAGSRAEVVFS